MVVLASSSSVFQYVSRSVFSICVGNEPDKPAFGFIAAGGPEPLTRIGICLLESTFLERTAHTDRSIAICGATIGARDNSVWRP